MSAPPLLCWSHAVQEARISPRRRLDHLELFWNYLETTVELLEKVESTLEVFGNCWNRSEQTQNYVVTILELLKRRSRLPYYERIETTRLARKHVENC